MLTNANFTGGTYRIQVPGVYRLAEDIVFAPRPDNDYWPTPGDPNYPMHIYYLGFFAGITIECANVVLDLNGKTLRQSKIFYLKQRFWNNIELADRVFVDNEGVGNLNYQTGDKQQWTSNDVADATTFVPPIKSASNVVIRNGRLGLSSHSGIHGNGARGVAITNVEIVDWEVSGIHCNACNDVLVSGAVVGPTSSQVPALATFSNARFLTLLTTRIIPAGFARESIPVQQLLQPSNTITFADRPGQPVPLTAVFERCRRAEDLYTQYYMGTLPASLSPEDTALLKEARRIFTNRKGVTDGSVVYGMIFNHLGLPNDDEDFFGSGLETSNILVRDSVIRGLVASPLEVVAVRGADGVFAQGVARDLFRIYDVTDDAFRTLVGSHYKGDPLHDAYLALWKLANDFYEARIIGTGCGNFASNSTLTWRPYRQVAPPGTPEAVVGTCQHAGFTPRDPKIRGRDASLYQKKYFGGLALSQGLFDWATKPGATLQGLFTSRQVTAERVASKHFLVCDLDTMFHPMQGVVGIKGRWVRGLTITNVQISNLTNLGEDESWLCKQTYRLPNTGEDVVVEHSGSNARGGADVRGIFLELSEDVTVNQVSISDLDSDEGRTIGIDYVGDVNDRSNYTTLPGIKFVGTSVTGLRAGHGSKAYPVRLGDNQVSTMLQGLTSGTPAKLENNFRQPKTVISYGLIAGTPYLGPDGLPLFGLINGAADRWLQEGPFSTMAEVRAFRDKALAFFTRQFGLEFYPPSDNLNDPIGIVGVADTAVVLIALSHAWNYVGGYICTASRGCSSPRNATSSAKVYDYLYLIAAGPSGLVVRGVFGGDAGKLVPAGDYLVAGTYSFEAGEDNFFTVPGSSPPAAIHVEYFGTCPLSTARVPDGTLLNYLDCALESKHFGQGRASGTIIARPIPGTNPPRNEIWTSHLMIFDDEVAHPPVDAPPPKTALYSDTLFPLHDVEITTIADGALMVAPSDMAHEILPYTAQFHWLHEAGTKYLMRFTSVKNESAIRALRREFLVMLRDKFGIAAADPDRYQNNPIENQIDLGVGNTVAPYAVSELFNQRWITKRRSGGAVQAGLDARLHEGGFRLLVGRGGIKTTTYGYLPAGTLIVKGIYVVEGDPDLGTHEIGFETSVPTLINDWAIMMTEQRLSSAAYGEGFANIIAPPPLPSLDGWAANVRSTFIFKNAYGNWPGPCLTCAKKDNPPE